MYRLTNIDNISLLQPTLIWDPVADDLIDRRANRFRKIPVAKGGWIGIPLNGLVVDNLIDLIGGYARFDAGGGSVQDFSTHLEWETVSLRAYSNDGICHSLGTPCASSPAPRA